MPSSAFYARHIVIPLALLLRLESVGSLDDLQKTVDDINNTNAQTVTNSTLGARRLEQTVEKKGYVIPEFAKCMPELRTVRLGPETGDFYFPGCTRIERCGGCCVRDDVLSCQPTHIETVNFMVVVLKYVGGTTGIQRSTKIVPVEKHLKCQCDCKLKPKDCNPLQDYNKSNCECVCTNKDEKEKCLESSHIKTWKSDTCTCQCLKERDCNTGYVFNKHTCSCEAIQRPRIKNGGSYSTDTRLTLNRKEEYSILNAG